MAKRLTFYILLGMVLGLIAVIMFGLLFLLTGSVVLPLSALILNVLSLTAAFGVQALAVALADVRPSVVPTALSIAAAGVDYQTPLVAGTDYEVPLTFGNGVTRTANAIANDLTTGKAGGHGAVVETVLALARLTDGVAFPQDLAARGILRAKIERFPFIPVHSRRI